MVLMGFSHVCTVVRRDSLDDAHGSAAMPVRPARPGSGATSRAESGRGRPRRPAAGAPAPRNRWRAGRGASGPVAYWSPSASARPARDKGPGPSRQPVLMLPRWPLSGRDLAQQAFLDRRASRSLSTCGDAVRRCMSANRRRVERLAQHEERGPLPRIDTAARSRSWPVVVRHPDPFHGTG